MKAGGMCNSNRTNQVGVWVFWSWLEPRQSCCTAFGPVIGMV